MIAGLGGIGYCRVHDGYSCPCSGNTQALMSQYNAMIGSMAAQQQGIALANSASILVSNGSGLGMVVGSSEPEPNNLLLLLE